ncbi:MAG: hypothetical protein HUU21_21480 [Polyangiaceae bacterium]|nr:hypothetical protein [Polyangiaceae bacterium]
MSGPARSGGERLDRLVEELHRRGLRLGDAAIWFIALRVAGELSRAHAATGEEGLPKPVLHLALEPDRVFIHENGEVEVLWPPAGEGNAAWSAPEQRAGGRVTHRADVYRFGLLIWWLSAGRLPAPGEIDKSKKEIQNGLTLGILRPDIPGDVAAAIEAALEPSAARRTITCVELEQWLEPMARADAGRRMLVDSLRLIAIAAEEKKTPPEIVVEEKPFLAPPLPIAAPAPPVAAPAPPVAARPDPGARRLSPLQSIGVAAVTATLVFAIGTYIGDRAQLRNAEDSAQSSAETP